jgi:hypothetical protein
MRIFLHSLTGFKGDHYKEKRYLFKNQYGVPGFPLVGFPGKLFLSGRSWRDPEVFLSALSENAQEREILSVISLLIFQDLYK